MTWPASFPILFRRRIPGAFGNVPPPVLTPPSATMGWDALWDFNSNFFSDAGITPCVNNDPCYRFGEQLGVVSNAYFEQTGAAGIRPTFKTGGLGGKNYLSFNSANSQYMISLAISNFFTNSAKSILIAFIPSTGFSNLSGLLKDSSGYWRMYLTTGAGGSIVQENFGVGGASTSISISGLSDTLVIVTAKHDGGRIYIRTAKNAWGAGVATSVTDLMTGLLWLGRHSTYLLGHVYGVAVANSVISDSDFNTCVDYYSGTLV